MKSPLQFSSVPLALPTAAFIAGVLCVILLEISCIWWITITSCLTVALLLAMIIKGTHSRNLLTASVCLSLWTAGAADAWIQTPEDIEVLADAESMRGTVINSEATPNGSRSIITVDSIFYNDGNRAAISNLKLILATDSAELTQGESVLFRAKLTAPDSLPFLDSGKYAEMLKNKGIAGYAYSSGNMIRTLGEASGAEAAASRMRNNMESVIAGSSMQPATKGFITAILTGGRGMIDTRSRKMFSGAGLAHILALSGLHLAIIAAIVSTILLPLNIFLHFKIRFILIVILLWAFTLFTGFSPPTVRACVMATVFYAASILERPHFRFNSLCAAILVIVAADPLSIVDAGFQLSIICVLSILLFADRLNPADRRKNPALYSSASILTTSVAATLGSWLITAYYFGHIPLLAIPANIIAIPLSAPYLTLALTYFACLASGWDAAPLRWLLDKGYEAIELLAESASSATLAFTPSAESVILWTVGMLLCGIALHVRRKGWFRFLPGTICLAGGILTSLFIGTPVEQGLIISQSHGILTINHRYADKEATHIYQRGATGSASCGPLRYAVLQRPLESMTPAEIDSARKADIIVVAGSYKGEIDALVEDPVGKTLILGPNIRKKEKARIITGAERLSLTTHDIMLNGHFRKNLGIH